MKPGLSIGAHCQETIQVDESLQAKAPLVFGGECIHPLLGTASLIESLEWISRKLVVPYLEDGEEGAGAALEFRHLALVAIGETVRLYSEVLDVNERRVKTKIQAFHHDILIADGIFTQAIIQKSTFYATLPMPKRPVSPPIYLHTIENNYQLSIELLDWESKLICTPYDEWLMCRIQLTSPLGTQSIEGPVLLRIEVERIIQALSGMISQDTSLPFESDFLESTLKLTLNKKADKAIILGITIQSSDSKNDAIRLQGIPEDPDVYPISFPLDSACILPWCQSIKTRLIELQEQL